MEGVEITDVVGEDVIGDEIRMERAMFTETSLVFHLDTNKDLCVISQRLSWNQHLLK